MTRCNLFIKAKGVKCWLYHHQDGHPGFVGAVLKEFISSRTYYYTASLVNNILKGIEYTDCCSETGKNVDNEWEWTVGQHGDIDYLYVLNIKDYKHCTLECIDVRKNVSVFKEEYKSKY